MNIFEQAKDAGFTVTGGRIESPYIGGSDIGQRLKEFAALVRAESLEEAAKVCDDEQAQLEAMGLDEEAWAAGYCARQIRGLK